MSRLERRAIEAMRQRKASGWSGPAVQFLHVTDAAFYGQGRYGENTYGVGQAKYGTSRYGEGTYGNPEPDNTARYGMDHYGRARYGEETS